MAEVRSHTQNYIIELRDEVTRESRRGQFPSRILFIAGGAAFLAEPFLILISENLNGNFAPVFYGFSGLSFLTLCYAIILFLDRKEPSASRRPTVFEHAKIMEDLSKFRRGSQLWPET